MKELIESLKVKLENNKLNEKELESTLTQIKFFQHERLIHLIVTFFVGISAIITLGFSLITEIIALYILFGILFILFINYIFYYYYLENNIQYLYKLYLKQK